MAKFTIGDKVKVKTSGATGVVKTVFESGYWNMMDDEYGVEFDDGSGMITLVEKVLEANEPPPACQCGLKFSRHGGKHSRWCKLYDPNA